MPHVQASMEWQVQRIPHSINALLHRRYGRQWHRLPLITLPGVVNVHRDLRLREKLRRIRYRGVWPDSVIVRADIE